VQERFETSIKKSKKLIFSVDKQFLLSFCQRLLEGWIESRWCQIDSYLPAFFEEDNRKSLQQDIYIQQC
jgi:hypothetical protein